MGQYIVASNDGNLNIVNQESITVSDVKAIEFSEIDGTSANPNPVWTSGSMYARFFQLGSDAGCTFTLYNGSTQTVSIASPNTSVIASYTVIENEVEYLYVVFNVGSDVHDAISRIQSNTGNFVMYYDTLENALNDGVAEENKEWEDNPEDYDPGESQGGANADLGPIDSDDLDDGFLNPIDPNAETPTDDPDNENNHNANYFRLMQPYLLNDGLWTTFQDLFWYNADQPGSLWHTLLTTIFNGATDPLSAIAGLIRLPLSNGCVALSGKGNMYLGGQMVEGGQREAKAYYVANRYTKIVYGLRLKEVFGTYYDYTQTDIQLFLPYVNTVNLDASQVMDSVLRVSYIIDVYTGDLLCTLNCQKSVYGKNLNSIIGRWKGNCAMPQIFSRANTQQHAQNLINGAFGVGGGLIGANFGGAVGSALGMMTDQRIKTEKIGNVGGSAGWMDIQVPYLIIKRNVPLYPEDWRKIKGAEQHATRYVSELSGYTEFSDIHIHVGNGATDEEKAEIENILKSGVII